MKKLIIIPTPIGNLSDVSDNMRISLGSLDVLLCESISQTKKLYQCLSLPLPKLVRYWQKTEDSVIENLEDLAGEVVGLISDAGMPGISDPGYLVISHWHEKKWPIQVIAGPSAIVLAVALSGIPAESFQFLGFLSSKSAARESQLLEAKQTGVSVVVYESPRRVLALCQAIEKVYGKAHLVCVMKELTKVHESYYRGAVGEVVATLSQEKEIKGEFVVVINRANKLANWEKTALVLKQHLSVSDAASICSEIHTCSRSKVYQFLLEK